MTSSDPNEANDSSRAEDEVDSSDGRSNWARAVVVVVFGAELAGFIIAGIWFGQWADQRFGIGPYGVLVGLFLALTAAGFHLWKLSTRFLESGSSTSEREDDA